MADEAQRSQYGLEGKLNRETGEWKYGMAKYMRDSLPNATFIGFTGTPIDFDDRSTVEVFVEYIDIYDMTRRIWWGMLTRNCFLALFKLFIFLNGHFIRK